MRDEDILLDPVGDERRFRTFLRPRRSRGPGVVAGVILLVVALAAAGWYFFLRPADGVEAPGLAAADPGVAPASPGPGLADDGPLTLPAVDTSDIFVRRLIAGLSAHPQFAEWLVTDELARRFVATIAALAQGTSPTPQLRFMMPGEPFRVRNASSGMMIDATSYQRYDAMSATFASLDTEGTATLIRRLTPLFEEAHRELGLPGRTFEGDLRQAIANVLAVQVPERAPLVVRGEEGWMYADPALESAPPAARHLIRMGPVNAARIQDKLAELAAALGVQPGAPG